MMIFVSRSFAASVIAFISHHTLPRALALSPALLPLRVNSSDEFYDVVLGLFQARACVCVSMCAYACVCVLACMARSRVRVCIRSMSMHTRAWRLSARRSLRGAVATSAEYG